MVLYSLLVVGLLAVGLLIERRPFPFRSGPAFIVLSEIGLLWGLWFFAFGGPADPGGAGFDFLSYWGISLDDPYRFAFGPVDQVGAFRYAPPIAFVLAPLGALPFKVFAFGLTILLFATLVFLAGRYALVVLAFPPVVISIWQGNIDLLLAASVALGLRYPGTWAFGILTKVTPGIGLLWFVVRREWRSLAIALGVTAAIALPTILLRPDLWSRWLAALLQTGSLPDQYASLLPIRLAIGAALIIFAARTERAWILGIAIALAQPPVVLRGFTVAVASVYLATHRESLATVQTGRSASRGGPPSVLGTENTGAPIQVGLEVPSSTGVSVGTVDSRSSTSQRTL